MKLKKTSLESLKGRKFERKTRDLFKSEVLKQKQYCLQFPFLSWFRKLAIKRLAVAVLINKDRFCNTIVTVTKFKAISDCRQRKFLQPVNLTNTAAKVAWKSVGQIFTFCQEKAV